MASTSRPASGLAEPGGIAISGAVYDQISNKLDLEFRDRGSHTVKNIATPVRVYTVEAEGAGGARRTFAEPRAPGLIWLSTGVLAAVGGSGRCFSGRAHRRGSTMKQRDRPVETQPEVAAKPAIAVLPFENQGGDPKNATSPTASPRTSSARWAASPTWW